jgi:hypothetical protein
MKRLIPLVFILAACDSAAPPQSETAPNPAFASQIQALEKARAVESQLMDAAMAQRKQVDEATQQ